MPRTGRGGGANPNRTDLNTATPTGDEREWGSRTRDEEAMAQVPVRPQQPAAEEPVLPGSMGPLAAPTNRSSEPITNGIALGPGRGPEARMIREGDPYRTPLERAAMLTGNPRIKQMVRARYGS